MSNPVDPTATAPQAPGAAPTGAAEPAGRALPLPIWRSPAFVCGAGCWLAAAGWLACRGFGGLVAAAAVLAILIALLCGATAWLTSSPPADNVSQSTRRRIAFQLGWTLLWVAITAYEGLAFHRESAGFAAVPWWSALLERVAAGGAGSGWAAWLGTPSAPNLAVVNPVRYCLLPLLWLVPWTGFRFLGLGRGRRVASVAALWLALPLAWIGWQLASGQLACSALGSRLLANALRNGFSEEFLFRGILQTRLRILAGAPLGLVGTALLFGIWHLGLGLQQTGTHSLLDGLASTIVWQATVGYAFGYLYHRTGNLLASSLLHTVANST